ncbi:universal stress protein [Liquorilactobacillus cacaonum]|uniref:Universal stress protein n=1 Tax=Liquorilactobacillus cacaonum DSM 21116 TaxID=1423729 RepID=A0A0R2CFR7_9LACO|nr:universal stress protein [Liquorilactobacillus cacaonum]KRM90343.1 universal stress protein [Liquorilactobacillus cacaonum DSM 21116]
MEQNYRSILVPVDGSKNAEKALEKAIEIAKRNNSSLEILNVIDTKQFTNNFGGIISISGDVVYSTFETVKQYLEKLKERILKDGFNNVEVHARFGSPRVVIAKDFVDDYPIDLIVLGKTGMSTVSRIFVGSVTDGVIRTASCDVLVVG